MKVTPAYLLGRHVLRHVQRSPSGRHDVYVCTSVACMPAQREGRVRRDQGGRRQDLDDVHIREFECLGACDMAPMASVDGRYVGPLDPATPSEIVGRD